LYRYEIAVSNALIIYKLSQNWIKHRRTL